MSAVYEGMFLLDNAVVREDWQKAKAIVIDALQKYGATVQTARRWDERKLAYTIKGKNRATFLIVYFSMPAAGIAPMRREFDLSDRVLRYLMVKVEAVPANEAELAAAENSADFVVPTPPPDDMVEAEPAPQAAPGEEVLVPDLEELGELEDRPRGRRTEAKASTEV